MSHLPPGAPLLPKLRGQFAEFLNEGSPVRLKALTPAHLCRFAVRSTNSSTRPLLGSSGSVGSPLGLPASSRSPLSNRLSPATHRLRRGLQHHAQPTSKRNLASLALALFTVGRYRNINLLSIAYGYYPLGLGPTNPTRIHLPSETLGLRRTRFARAFSLLIPAFALELAPGSLTTSLPCRSTLPYPWVRARTPTRSEDPISAHAQTQATASVVGLSPDGLSVQDHSTSELLRTLSRMAASKPTSWLSQHAHLVCH